MKGADGMRVLAVQPDRMMLSFDAHSRASAI